MTLIRTPSESHISSLKPTILFHNRIPPSPPLSTSDSLGAIDYVSEREPKSTIPSKLLEQFLEAHEQGQRLKNGSSPVIIDGEQLTIPKVAAVARFAAPVALDTSPALRTKLEKSRRVIDSKIEAGTSIYGISTGFGGSADTRTTDYESLGLALMQHQHIGVLPSNLKSISSESDEKKEAAPLPLLDPLNALSMPPSWVRAAILVRINSLVRGQSAVTWQLVENMAALLVKNITPVVPLRGSISASGDLSPLSYVAGTLMGGKNLYAYTASNSPTSIMPAAAALKQAGMTPLVLKPKEHLGILNGTAFSAGVAALACDEAVHLALLANVCTAMGTEALLGSRASHLPFIHETCRPHPGQVESARLVLSLLNGSRLASGEHEKDVTVDQDVGKLRQDRYPLRTAPQFLGPQMEDILHAWESITIECNSTTDNPLVDGETGQIYHAGNFQAMSVSNAMEKTRLAIHHIGKLLFAQSTELLNPAFNWGLPPSVAATDPSLNYHCKGLDIATASYVGELGWLANPVTTHIQSAEMHNQAVNSLALISARATIQSLDVLKLLMATYIYILCQALDLRAMQIELQHQVDDIINDELASVFSQHISSERLSKLNEQVRSTFHASLEATATMDADLRMQTAAQASSAVLLQLFAAEPKALSSMPLSRVTDLQATIANQATVVLQTLRVNYLSGKNGPIPASQWMGRTRAVYEFVRVNLGIKMHGQENLDCFKYGVGVENTIGENVSKIYEALCDGEMQKVVANLF